MLANLEAQERETARLKRLERRLEAAEEALDEVYNELLLDLKLQEFGQENVGSEDLASLKRVPTLRKVDSAYSALVEIRQRVHFDLTGDPGDPPF